MTEMIEPIEPIELEPIELEPIELEPIELEPIELDTTNPRGFYNYAHELYARYNFVYKCKQDGILDKTHAMGLERLTEMYNFIAEHLPNVNQSLAYIDIPAYKLAWDTPPRDLLRAIYKNSKRVGFYDSAKLLDKFTELDTPLQNARAYLEAHYINEIYLQIHRMRYFTHISHLTITNRKDFLIVFFALVEYLSPPAKQAEIKDYILTEMDRIMFIPENYIVLKNRIGSVQRLRTVTRYREVSYIRKKWWAWFKWHYRWATRQEPYQVTEGYIETLHYMQEHLHRTEWRRDRVASDNPPSHHYLIKELGGGWRYNTGERATPPPFIY